MLVFVIRQPIAVTFRPSCITLVIVLVINPTEQFLQPCRPRCLIGQGWILMPQTERQRYKCVNIKNQAGHQQWPSRKKRSIFYERGVGGEISPFGSTLVLGKCDFFLFIRFNVSEILFSTTFLPYGKCIGVVSISTRKNQQYRGGNNEQPRPLQTTITPVKFIITSNEIKYHTINYLD